MERWVIIVGVLAIFASLGVAGWYFEPRGHDVTNMCANEQAQCGERRL
jgi:hypothetical protein